MSEKAYAQAQTANTYVFIVPKTTSKQAVAEAVAAQYDVTVKTVNVLVAKGKAKQTMRKGRPIKGRRSDSKKVYVTLAEGNSIKIFEEQQ
jgi:large subunit ribosomal protein L23